jgi:hypothetical protein
MHPSIDTLRFPIRRKFFLSKIICSVLLDLSSTDLILTSSQLTLNLIKPHPPESMNIIEALHLRKSIRAFLDKPVEEKNAPGKSKTDSFMSDELDDDGLDVLLKSLR